jgi:hypothetical protein
MRTIGGFAVDVHDRDDTPFIGWLDVDANSAKRDGGKSYSCPPDLLTRWLDEQWELLKDEVDPFRRLFATGSFLQFEYDPRELLTVLVAPPNDPTPRFAGMEQLIEAAKNDSLAFLTTEYDYTESLAGNPTLADGWLVRATGPGHCSLKFVDEAPAPGTHLTRLIHQACVAKGLVPLWRREETTNKNQFGRPVGVLRLTAKQAPAAEPPVE